MEELKNSPSILFSSAAEKQSEGLFDEALRGYKKVQEVFPNSKESKLASDRIKEIKKKKADAKKQKEEEIKAKEESRKSPLELVDTYLKLNSISNPEVYLVVKYISNKTIDAYDVAFHCYDRYDEPVNHYLYNNRFEAISQKTIKPGETFGYEYFWTLYGHENTTKVKAVLKRVHMTDDTVWIPEYDQEVSVEEVLNE